MESHRTYRLCHLETAQCCRKSHFFEYKGSHSYHYKFDCSRAIYLLDMETGNDKNIYQNELGCIGQEDKHIEPGRYHSRISSHYYKGNHKTLDPIDFYIYEVGYSLPCTID